MCSTAGSENPSYSDGTTASWALASSPASSSWLIPCRNRTCPASPSSPASLSVGPPGVSLLTTTRRACGASRPTWLNARSSVVTPFIGESALATATMRPGTRGAGRGWNSRVSTPSGMTRTLSGSVPKSLQMSRLEDSETVRIGPFRLTRCATRPCIRTNAYHRRLDSRERPRAACSSIRRSTLTG